MQKSPRRPPPSYPAPTYAQPMAATSAPPRGARTQQSTGAGRSHVPLAPPAPPAAHPTSQRAIVIRPGGLQVLSLGGILHASLTLMALFVIIVMAVGGDARVAEANRTIKQQSMALWTWTIFALLTAFVLGFVMLYNAIGMLSVAPWSHRTTRIWSAVFLALATVALVVNLGWIYPMLKDAEPDRFNFARLLTVTWLHIAAGIVWPIVVLVYLNLRHVKQTFQRIAGGAASI